MNKSILPTFVTLILIISLSTFFACNKDDTGYYAKGKGWIVPISVVQKSPLNFRTYAALIDGQIIAEVDKALNHYQIKDQTGTFVVQLKRAYAIGSYVLVKGKTETILGAGYMALVEQ
jgi:hypothetical protein